MVFISLQPFDLKKVSLLIAAIICLLTASCFADAVFLSGDSARYDHQMSRNRRAVSSSETKLKTPEVSIALMDDWMIERGVTSCGFSEN